MHGYRNSPGYPDAVCAECDDNPQLSDNCDDSSVRLLMKWRHIFEKGYDRALDLGFGLSDLDTFYLIDMEIIQYQKEQAEKDQNQ